MNRIGFADESGTTNGLPCYTIGVVCISSDKVFSFEKHFKNLIQKHGVCGEVKWTRVRKSHGLINFALEWLHDIFLSDTATFDAIVVNKALFRNWGRSELQKETAFYQTYTYLLRHIVSRTSSISEIFIDDRHDSYTKRHEMIETIGNHMLNRLASSGRLDSVSKISSKYCMGVQIADILAGAINSSHIRHLNSKHSLNAGKRLAISRLANIIGWDDLCYDTYPHDKFNIWHFPIEYRAQPRTRHPNFQNILPFISPDEIDCITTG